MPGDYPCGSSPASPGSVASTARSVKSTAAIRTDACIRPAGVCAICSQVEAVIQGNEGVALLLNMNPVHLLILVATMALAVFAQGPPDADIQAAMERGTKTPVKKLWDEIRKKQQYRMNRAGFGDPHRHRRSLLMERNGSLKALAALVEPYHAGRGFCDVVSAEHVQRSRFADDALSCGEFHSDGSLNCLARL